MMHACTYSAAIEFVVETSNRGPKLFEVFVPKAASMVVLNSVDQVCHSIIVEATKLFVALTTIYDDAIDGSLIEGRSSDKLVSDLLSMVDSWDGRLQQPNGCEPIDAMDPISLCVRIWWIIAHTLKGLPNFDSMRSMLWFDIIQHFQAHRYSHLIGSKPTAWLNREAEVLLPHSIALMVFGGMSLCAVPRIYEEELGVIRGCFLEGQTILNRANDIASLKREFESGERDSLLLRAYGERLLEGIIDVDEVVRSESSLLMRDSRRAVEAASPLKTFDSRLYFLGVQNAARLYISLNGEV